MTPAQLQTAFALDRVLDARGISTDGARHTMVCHGLGASMIIDLADPTGATEGVLHRVLEKLVGESVPLVPVWGDGKLRGWLAERAHSRHRMHDRIFYPARIDAIVAAILAIGDGK